jgi:hypothetical protein
VCAYAALAFDALQFQTQLHNLITYCVTQTTHAARTPTEAAAAAAALQLKAAAVDQQQDKPTDKRGKHKKPLKSQGEEARHTSSVASRQRLLEDTRVLLRKGVFVPVSWGHRCTVLLFPVC